MDDQEVLNAQVAEENEKEEQVPQAEKDGLLKVKEVKTYGLTDNELTRILEFRRIAEIQREMEGIFLDQIAITRFARDPKAIRMFYLDFKKKSMTVREYDEKEYEKYQTSLIEKQADAKEVIE